jgi:hypothetical protein
VNDNGNEANSRSFAELWRKNEPQTKDNFQYSMAQRVVRPVNAEAWLQAQSAHLGFVAEKVAMGQVSCPATFVFPCQYHSTGAPYLFVCHRPCMDIEMECAVK